MKRLKLLLLAVVMTLSTAVLANTKEGSANEKPSVSYEIAEILDRSNLFLEEDLELKVFFTVGEGKKIRVLYIQTKNEEVKNFLQKRLENQQLTGAGWEEGMAYELPVKVQVKK